MGLSILFAEIFFFLFLLLFFVPMPFSSAASSSSSASQTYPIHGAKDAVVMTATVSPHNVSLVKWTVHSMSDRDMVEKGGQRTT